MPDPMAPSPLPTLADIQAAAAAIAPHIQRTPFQHSATLSALTGVDLFIKFENLQYTASFKERGALNKLLTLDAGQRAAGVIAMSAGNHAQGVARHAGRMGIPAVIVMPEGTPFVKVAHTRDHGAQVILAGASVAEARAVAETKAEDHGLTFIHPYDDAAVIAGQGTVALEMLADQPELDALVAPIGGGGLLSGMAIAAKALDPDIDIVGVQASLYPAMAQVVRDRPIDIPGGATVAEGIAVSEPGKLTRRILQPLLSDILLVDEAKLEEAINLYITVEKTVAEGAGAAALAAILSAPERFRGRKVGLVLCGGNIDPRLLASVLMRGLVRQERLCALSVAVGDQPGQLALVASTIAETGANIVDVQHQRLLSDLSIKSTDLDVIAEIEDSAHGDRILAALAAAGFRARKRPFLRGQ